MISGNRNIVIHIGMPKAASTSLQKNFFARLPLINYSGIYGDNKTSRYFFKKVIFEKEVDYITTEVYDGIEKDFKKQLPIVFSNESVSMPILKQFKKIPQEREIIAKRVKTLYPKAKILIIIRNQFKIHQSNYVQTLKAERDSIPFKNISFNKWIDWNRELEENDLDNVFRFADYYSLIRIYKKMFSEVKVVVFEDMIKDMRGFVKDDLCPFIGVDTTKAMPYYEDKIKNKRRSKNSMFVENIIRVSLNFFRNKLGNPQKIISIEKRRKLMIKVHKIIHFIPYGKVDTNYSAEHQKFIEGYYSEGNRKVSEIIGIDLGKYGYPV